MFALLTSEWGLRENLALALVDIYGGHIWGVFNAIKKLNSRKGRMIGGFGLTNVSSIVDCLNLENEKLTETLKELAKKGFVHLKTCDSAEAREISRRNIGGVVHNESLILGFDERFWKGLLNEYGLVPSRQSIRLAIAIKMIEFNKAS